MSTRASASTQSDLWHTLSAENAVARLASDRTRGLAEADATSRLARVGPNRLAEAKPPSMWSLFFRQFRSLVVLLLVAAGGIAFATGDTLEACAILVVVVLNATIGFLTEWKAESALAGLRKLSVPVARIVRDGLERQIPAAELVPGDLVVLAAGARVPADGRIVESRELRIDESTLTGESTAVAKSVDRIDDQGVALPDRVNMAFMGTVVASGRGLLLTTDTGGRTQLGRIGALIETAHPRMTPLEEKLAELGRFLIFAVLVLCAIVALAGWLEGMGDLWHMLEIGISLAIAAVPEGLPAVATMTLAIGMQRMARRAAIVRRLHAVETLGSTTVICTDKTGTLTKNEMTVTLLVVGGRRIEVTGAGYAARGEFREAGVAISPSDEPIATALRVGCLCNDAQIERAGDAETALGDPTEAALIGAAEKAGWQTSAVRREYPRLAELPFDSARKKMTTVHRTPQGRTVAYVKGSPGTILAASGSWMDKGEKKPLGDEDRRRWETTNEELAAGALRVLGLAFRELPDDYTPGDLERELVFVGLVGMIDPLRDEAKDAIDRCRKAGIRVVMITGDQQLTAAEIARQLGIDADDQGHPLRTVHGRELAGLDREGWRRTVATTSVFARVSPEHKLEIVDALVEQGHVVAMTGDGVNDAPALKRANIGVVMGIKGTDVAKESADLVITDDNFATIVTAVEQGRAIYSNILRFIHYLLSCNLAEICTIFFAVMVRWPLPLGALQILWLNIVTDVFPALALALEPSSPGAMERPPVDPKKALLSPAFIGLIVWQGILLAAATLVAFAIALRKYGSDDAGLVRATTIAFLTLGWVETLHTFNARSRRESIFNRRLFTNGWLWGAVALCLALQWAAVSIGVLRRVLHTTQPSLDDWLVVAVCSLAPVAVVEATKWISRRKRSVAD